MIDLLTLFSSLGSMSDLNSSSVNRSRNFILSMNCRRPTMVSKSILSKPVVALKPAFMSDIIIFESSLRYCGLFPILIMTSTSRVGKFCWSEMLNLFFCNPPRFNSAVASAFHDSKSERHQSWRETTAGFDFSLSVAVAEQVRWYLQYCFIFVSESLAFDGIQCSVLKSFMDFFIDIVYSISNHLSLHGSKHAIFFLCPSCFWRGKTSSGFVIFKWVDSAFSVYSN